MQERCRTTSSERASPAGFFFCPGGILERGRGERLARPSAKSRAKDVAVISAQAATRAADLAATVAELRASGATSLRALAAGLNARGIPMARGSGSVSLRL